MVHCRYQRLQGIPAADQFPADTVELDYGHNNVSSLTSLPGLTNLQKLVLDNCEIQSLGSRAFANVPSLRNITLSQNKIDSIHPNAFENLPNLIGLYMEDNNVKVLPEELFTGLGLQDLYLEGNAIHRLDDKTFAGLSVNHLNMKRNNISRVTARHLAPLKSSLVSLHLDQNGRELTVEADTFTGFSMLEVLSVRASHLQDLAFLHNVNVKTLYLSGNTFPELDLLPYRGLSSVETLGLADMGLQSFRANKVLYSLSSLRQLDMSNNGILIVEGSWFQYTPLLTHLNLASNTIFQLPADLGTYLGKLTSLDLAMNILTSIRTESFDSMAVLRKLDLRNNKLQVFSSVLEPLFNRVPELLLKGNPLHCNCEMRWYVMWLYSGAPPTAAHTCFSPRREYIFNLPLDDLVCRAPSIVTIDPVVYVTPGEDVFLRCIGEGDPAPIVEWTDPEGETLTISPSPNRTRYKTFSTWKLSAVTEDYTGNYTCRAKNVQGEVYRVTLLVVSDDPPPTTSPEPTTAAIPTTLAPVATSSASPSSSTPAPTTAAAAETRPMNAHSRTPEVTTTVQPVGKKAMSQRTLAIVIGVAGAAIILLFLVLIIFHICRYNRHRRRYDVNDKAIIYHPDTHELDISKDSKQIDV